MVPSGRTWTDFQVPSAQTVLDDPSRLSVSTVPSDHVRVTEPSSLVTSAGGSRSSTLPSASTVTVRPSSHHVKLDPSL